MLIREGAEEDTILSALCELGADVLERPEFQGLRRYPQHGNASRYEHVLSVGWFSLAIARKLGIRVDERSLVRGALLHDYFLYDWHDVSAGRTFHGFTHAGEALRTAEKAFELNPVERNIIRRHMFPMNPTPPKYREAWIVSAADKVSALLETLRVPLALAVSERCSKVRPV